MRVLGNVLWHFPFFGFVTATLTWLLGLLLTVTIVASPIGLGLMQFGKFLFAPFSYTMVSKADLKVEQNVLWESYSIIVMILYLPIGAIIVLISAIQIIGLCLSIVGIPVALVVAKSLTTLLNPVNKICVHRLVAEELAHRRARETVDERLGPR